MVFCILLSQSTVRKLMKNGLCPWRVALVGHSREASRGSGVCVNLGNKDLVTARSPHLPFLIFLLSE